MRMSQISCHSYKRQHMYFLFYPPALLHWFGLGLDPPAAAARLAWCAPPPGTGPTGSAPPAPAGSLPPALLLNPIHMSPISLVHTLEQWRLRLLLMPPSNPSPSAHRQRRQEQWCLRLLLMPLRIPYRQYTGNGGRSNGAFGSFWCPLEALTVGAQATTPWLGIQMPHPHPVNAPTLPIEMSHPHRGRERCSLPIEYRLARLSALAAQTSTASSPRSLTSPRCRHRHNGSCSPSPRYYCDL
jgi:hypothetical protein